MSVHVSGDVDNWVEEDLDKNREETSASFDNRNHDEKSWQPCFILTLDFGLDGMNIYSFR